MRATRSHDRSSMRLPAAGRTARRAAVLAVLVTIAAPTLADGEASKLWPTGAYTFSDETGGYRITGASGKGTRDDPVVVTEELDSATPVTLTIRARPPIRLFDPTGIYASGVLYMRVKALNGSGLAWVEFEFELQEQPGQPSTFGDGLSFDQRSQKPENIGSSNFTRFDREFEPYDRLLFKNGKVDPRKTVTFDFLITDYTPTLTFYLVQDPRIPST
jgi:hypothetical protein